MNHYVFVISASSRVQTAPVGQLAGVRSDRWL